MQQLPGSQLCSGHEQGKSRMSLQQHESTRITARASAAVAFWGRRTWNPNNKIQKGAISLELSRETTADLLSICQQVPQIPTSVGEGDVLLRKGLVTKRPMCSEWRKTHDCPTSAV